MSLSKLNFFVRMNLQLQQTTKSFISSQQTGLVVHVNKVALKNSGRSLQQKLKSKLFDIEPTQ